MKTIAFTIDTGTSGKINEIVPLYVLVSGGIGTDVVFTQTGLVQFNITHTNGNHSTTDINGIASATIQVGNLGKAHITANIINPLGETNTATVDVYCIQNEIQIYITGIAISTAHFTDNPQQFFNTIDKSLRTIDGFEWFDLGINQSEIINSSSATSNQILIFIKEAKFFGSNYLDITNVDLLRSAIISNLQTIPGFTFIDVEIRQNRAYYI